MGEIEVQFEHTYQLGPADTEKFNPEQVKAVINDIFEKKFGDGFEYNADDAADMGTDVCTEIQDRVKELGYKRYKIITQVTLGEIKGQTMRIGSRCLWDLKTDNSASEVLTTTNTSAVRWFLACTMNKPLFQHEK